MESLVLLDDPHFDTERAGAHKHLARNSTYQDYSSHINHAV